MPNPTANVVIGNTATGNVTLNSSSGDTTVNSLSILASNALTISGVTLTSATGGGGISVAAGASLSLASGEINGSVLSGAGLFQTIERHLGARRGHDLGQHDLYRAKQHIDRAARRDRQCGHARADRRQWSKRSAVYRRCGDAHRRRNRDAEHHRDQRRQCVHPGGTGNQTLTNTNNTILGTGIIGNGSLALINGGVIDATPESGTSTLTLNGGGITNTGTMEATAGALLVIKPTVDNAGGTILTADATSTVELLKRSGRGRDLATTPPAECWRRSATRRWTAHAGRPDDQRRKFCHRDE